MPIELDPSKPVFSIGVAAELVQLNRSTLRMYEKEGLLCLHRDGKAKRLYSLNDLERLRYLFYLTKIRRIGIPGSRYMLEILEQVCAEDRARLLAEADSAIEGLPDKARAVLQAEMNGEEQPAAGGQEPATAEDTGRPSAAGRNSD